MQSVCAGQSHTNKDHERLAGEGASDGLWLQVHILQVKPKPALPDHSSPESGSESDPVRECALH